MKRISTLVLALLISSIALAQKVSLGFNLQKGETYYQKTEATSVITQEMMGQKMEIDMTIKGKMSFLVNEISEEGFHMTVKYDHLAMDMNIAGTSTSFDSDTSDPDDMVSGILAKLKEGSFQIVMSRTGKVLQVLNMDKIFDAMFEGQDLSDMEKKQIKSQMDDSFGEDSFIGNMEMATAIYPETKVKIGDHWSVDTKLQSTMKADISTDYALAAIESDYYLINGTSSISTNESDFNMGDNGFEMKFDLSGTMNSAIKVDKKSGWILEAKVGQKFGGTLTMRSEQLPEDMNVPMSVNTTMTYTN